MGLSSPNIPNANFTVTIKSQYIEIDKLLKLTRETNKIEIKYHKLDGNTVDQLRKAIANVVHVYDYKRVEDESIKQELKRIYVFNMSDNVDIDFNKLSNDNDPQEDYSYLLRNEIIKVLQARKNIMYNNMILNPTI